MACKQSEQCEHADTCRDVKSNDYNIVGCSCYKKTQTNEEWFCGLDTENKAREISDMTAQGYWEEELVYKWLREKHYESV